MRKLCALLISLPLTVMAGNDCQVLSADQHNASADCSQLQVVQNGETVSIQEIINTLPNGVNLQDLIIFGGEVPWPIVDENGNPITNGDDD